MRLHFSMASGLCLACAASAGNAAQLPAFSPFQINGTKNVAIAGINDSGVAVGSYWSAKSTAVSGFVGRSGHVVSLTSPAIPGYKAIPVPTSINNQGLVSGTYWAGAMQGFVWASGKYVTAFALGYRPTTAFPPVIAAGNVIGFNFANSFGASSIYAGKMSSPEHVNVGGFAVMQSVNSKSQVAGEFEWFVGNAPTNAVFLAQPSKVEPLLPRGAQSSSGGFLNELGQVGGSFVDQNGIAKGFFYSSGNYQIFNMPPESLGLTVQGINSSGTVVGIYRDRIYQHGFIYRSGVVTTFGNWDIGNDIQVRLSPLGAWIALSVQSASANSSQAFLARCGC